MTKKGGRIASWKRRWFVLGPEKIEYFTDQDKKTQKGSVTLADIIEVGHILHETRNHCIGIRTEKRLYVVSCEDDTAFDAWLNKLLEIQPKPLNAEFTNVPHTSLGNIEKQWFSFTGKKKKDKKDEKAPKEEGSTKESPPPTEGKPSSSGSIPTQDSNTAATTAENTQGSDKIDTSKNTTEVESAAPSSGNIDSNASRSAAVSLSQDTPSDPAPTPHSLSSSGAQDVQPPTNPSEPASTVVVTDSGAPAAVGTPTSSTGFGALHSSFDLDFGMTLNPALTAQPLEESPFSDTASGGPQTLTIPSPSPIIAQASPSEASPFE